ncbi:hypothetical protein R1CP_20380 [Rhodococcus opacus]|uniref:Uncharacterized protein n=1 Tax=Rhodococcus opacus TaxID=37919 RepID=A0A1B1K862_RHOOP|nr:hypothetical protein R1CP_20380 [Rhodococcus opacus]
MAMMSWRPLRIQAGASVMASSTCWIAGLTVTAGVRGRRVVLACDWRARAKRWVAFGVV